MENKCENASNKLQQLINKSAKTRPETALEKTTKNQPKINPQVPPRKPVLVSEREARFAGEGPHQFRNLLRPTRPHGTHERADQVD